MKKIEVKKIILRTVFWGVDTILLPTLSVISTIEDIFRDKPLVVGEKLSPCSIRTTLPDIRLSYNQHQVYGMLKLGYPLNIINNYCQLNLTEKERLEVFNQVTLQDLEINR